MAQARRRAIRFLVGVGILYLIHFGWFVFYGPPEWFEGVQERTPEITSIQLGSDYRPYLEPASVSVPALGAPRLPPSPEEAGRVVGRSGPIGDRPAWLHTRDADGDRVFVAREGDTAWTLWLDASGERWLDVATVLDAGEPVLILARAQGWEPYGPRYLRFWRALYDASLRPTVGLWRLDGPGAMPRYLFPGAEPQASPDGSRLAFRRAERRGFQSVHVWEMGHDGPTVIASLWTAGPGRSGAPGFRWSRDSAVLHVEGRTRGLGASRVGPVRDTELLWDGLRNRLVDVRRPAT